jgi:hypothetical protein
VLAIKAIDHFKRFHLYDSFLFHPF